MIDAACFGGAFRGRTVLVTGHTGFKGSWLALWLTALGAKVIGYSAYLPSDPCNFSVCGLERSLVHCTGDIRDLASLEKVISAHKPEIVFHLAAQPIVRTSYDQPRETFEVNALGTANVLECVRRYPGVLAVVMITSDKCYKNVEWEWGYRENDAVGGDDPYSASKACAELIIHSYAASFFASPSGTRIASVRAGNVIGGGDWAAARIVPDCIRSWVAGKEVEIRSPHSTRPWQHVLEPLSGYLQVGAELLSRPELHGMAFNFGPAARVNQSVSELITAMAAQWPGARSVIRDVQDGKKESGLLRLSCDRALALLGWHEVLPFADTVRFTSDWYRAWHDGGKDMAAFTREQIGGYQAAAVRQGIRWATTGK